MDMYDAVPSSGKLGNNIIMTNFSNSEWEAIHIHISDSAKRSKNKIIKKQKLYK